MVRPGAELVLLLEVPIGHRPCDLAVEFWRGEQLRDSWRRRLDSAGIAMAMRLHWGEARASSRLTCRVLIDGREVARQTALLGPCTFDAQGRFLDGTEPQTASPATLLAFTAELQRQLDAPAERS
jgi:hypothetical protein